MDGSCSDGTPRRVHDLAKGSRYQRSLLVTKRKTQLGRFRQPYGMAAELPGCDEGEVFAQCIRSRYHRYERTGGYAACKTGYRNPWSGFVLYFYHHKPG